MKGDPMVLCGLCQEVELQYAAECGVREEAARAAGHDYECTCPNVRCHHEPAEKESDGNT